MNSILRLNNVSFKYENDDILKNINLDITEGELIGIVGENGSGKSTLLKLILGINRPTTGDVIKEEKLRIGYVRQTTSTEDGVFPATVFETVSLGLKKKLFSFISKNDKEKVNKVLELFNLKSLKNESISSLSGGQLQKVKIAKVILSNPDLIILDEPTTGIDESSSEILYEMIKHLHAQRKTIIIVTHDKQDLELCTKVYKVIDKEVVINA